MKKLNIDGSSGTVTTFLKIVAVKVTNNASARFFDSEAKDFLQDHGFSGLKADGGNGNYLCAHPSEEVLILLEFEASETQQVKFKVIRVFPKSSQEIDSGYIVYRQDEPGPSQTFEINGIGDEIKDWTFTCVEVTPEEMEKGKSSREPVLALNKPDTQVSPQIILEIKPEKPFQAPLAPTVRKPVTQSHSKPVGTPFASPALMEAAKNARPFLKKTTPFVVTSAKTGPNTVGENGLGRGTFETEIPPTITTPVTQPAERIAVPMEAELEVTQQPPPQQTEKETTEPMKKSIIKAIVAFAVSKACELTNVDPKDLAEGGKNRNEARTKRIVVHVVKDRLDLSAIDEVKSPLGISGHATYYTMAKKGKKEFQKDSEFGKAVKSVEAAVRAEFKKELAEGGTTSSEEPVEVPPRVTSRPASKVWMRKENSAVSELSSEHVRDSAVFTLAQLGMPPEHIAQAFGLEVPKVHEVVGRFDLFLRHEKREDITFAIRQVGGQS